MDSKQQNTEESDSTAESRVCPRPRKKQKMILMRPETLQRLLDTIRDLKSELAARES